LEDIAEKAGVSRSTVSRVVNDFPFISDGVRDRVQKVIQETGYQPNAAARTLASQRSRIIGLILPFSSSALFTNPYYSLLIQGISQTCNQIDYTMAFFLASAKDDKKHISSRFPNNGLLDGVLIQSELQDDQELITTLRDSGIPHVVIGRPFQAEGINFVNVDNENAAYDAVSHLISLGYKRIATITGPMASTVGIDRKAGYIRALQENGIPVNQDLIVEGDFTDNSGYEAMLRLLSENLDAVFAASDVMAIGAIRAIKDKNLEVPRDIAMVGFDDMPSMQISDTDLTTIRQPIIQIGRKAVELLVSLIENENQSPVHILLDTELIIRSSCGSLKIKSV
jgi:LacI family transcriptional regulator